MSKVFVSDINLSNIADAIRAKNGAQTQYYPREMAAAITALDVEEHKPIQVNIQQSEHQTIKVKVKQKELNNTTINANVELPETIQLEATVIADEGYTPGTLNQSLVNAEWGDTVIYTATAATVAIVESETINVTIAMDDLSLAQGAAWPHITYNVIGWPNDTNDILNITTDTSNAQQTIGSHPASEFISYTVTYNDDPRKYNYNITMTGNVTVESASEPEPDPGPVPLTSVQIVIEGTEPDVIYDGQEHYPTEYEVTGWPDDTNDELVVTLVPSDDCVNVGTVTYTIEYEIIYNDNPRKYNYIVDEDQLEYTFQITPRPITI